MIESDEEPDNDSDDEPDTPIHAKRRPGPGERFCPYDGMPFGSVPGYTLGHGCPVCHAISYHHLPVPEPLTEQDKCDMLMQKINGLKGSVDSHMDAFHNEIGEIYSRARAEAEQRMLRGTSPAQPRVPISVVLNAQDLERVAEERDRIARNQAQVLPRGSVSEQPVKKEEAPKKEPEKPFLRKRRINW